MELLEHEANLFGTIPNEFAFAELREINSIDNDAPGSQRIQAAKNIDERGLAGTGGAHQRNPLARCDAETQPIDGAQRTIFLGERFDGNLGGAHASPEIQKLDEYWRVAAEDTRPQSPR